MHRFSFLLASMCVLPCFPATAWAGLHYSAERSNELPSQWRGLLGELRGLRSIAVAATPELPASPLREEYEADAKKLRETGKSRKLTADELADLGAIYVRLGDYRSAVDTLRPAARSHPDHFAIHANLGTAWQLFGELDQAEECLRIAVKLAPEKQKRAEEFHSRLVQLRRLSRTREQADELDDLFGVKFVNEKGEFEPGKLAAAEREKLPKDAVAIVQQLALWLPSDGKLLWLLGELANAHGDVRYADGILEICVGGFGMSSRTLRMHRAALRRLVNEWDKDGVHAFESEKLNPKEHAGAIAFKSRRPLMPRKFDLNKLPPISKTEPNSVPWPLLGETAIDQRFKPTFPEHLKGLDGLSVTLTGFMQPISEDAARFLLIEYPVGCWFCEMPEATGMVLVEIGEGGGAEFSRNVVKITGTLRLNPDDPETFLFTLTEARVTQVD